MDLGFGSLVEKFEEYFGRPVTAILLGFVGLGTIVIVGRLIIEQAGIPLYALLKDGASASQVLEIVLRLFGSLLIGCLGAFVGFLILRPLIRSSRERVKEARSLLNESRDMTDKSRQSFDQSAALLRQTADTLGKMREVVPIGENEKFDELFDELITSAESTIEEIGRKSNPDASDS